MSQKWIETLLTPLQDPKNNSVSSLCLLFYNFSMVKAEGTNLIEPAINCFNGFMGWLHACWNVKVGWGNYCVIIMFGDFNDLFFSWL